jgi:two-component system, cell cycle sensor histidine kinase and response regulator CckA
MKILVVDDLSVNRKLMRVIFESEGYTVIEANDGIDAIATLDREPVHAIVSDILMPRMDGYRFCYEVRKTERFSDIPFIVVSNTYTAPADEKLASNCGADRYFKQPVAATMLLDAVRELTTNKKFRGSCVERGPEDLSVIKEYSEVLVRKLEEKNLELQAGIEKLRLQGAALETAANSILLTNYAGRIIWVNNAFTKLTGYSIDEAIGNTPRLLKSGKHDAAFYREFWQTILAGQTWRGEFTNKRKDGSLFYDEHVVTPVRSPEGNITHFVSVMHDVTARKQTEAALRAAHEELRQLLEHSPAVLYRLKVEGDKITPVFGSPNIEQMLGFAVAETLSMEWWQAQLHPEDRDRAEASISETLTKCVSRTDYRIRHKDGSYRWVDDNRRLFLDSAGQPSEFIGVWTDITERKAADLALKENELRFRQMADNIQEVFWMTDVAKSEIVYVSPAFEAIWGRACSSLYESPKFWLEALHPEDRDRILHAAQTKQAAGNYDEEYRIVRPDGSVRWIHDKAFPVKSEAGEVYRIVGVAEDITARKHAERVALRSQRLESIGTLAGGIAHDLNNALAPILMTAELLRMKYPTETQTIDMIQASAKRGADMVRQLLNFSKGAEGERVTIQLRQLIQEMQKLVRGSFPKSIQLVVKGDSKPPAVLGDATQLHQVLLNLCINARDAMPEGGTLTLEVQGMEVDAAYARSIPDAKPGHYVVLRVRDTGVGIRPEVLDRIFEPFFTTKTPDKGTGLGLSTVLGIVRGHDGFLHVYSQPGQGSTFSVYLPIQSTRHETDLLTKAGVDFRGRGEMILLVDDEAPIRDVGRIVLSRLNLKPLLATDGVDGLIQVAEHRTELRAVVTDLHMPHMDGLNFVRAFRRMLPDIPVAVASGQMDDELIGEFKSLGVTILLAKPFTEAQLAEALKDLLSQE